MVGRSLGPKMWEIWDLRDLMLSASFSQVLSDTNQAQIPCSECYIPAYSLAKKLGLLGFRDSVLLILFSLVPREANHDHIS